MGWTLTTSGAATLKAGQGANTSLCASGAALLIFANQAEAQVNTLTRKDWVADYANVTANFKEILSDVTSDVIAMKIINYDMSGYTSRQEATTMLDVLRDNISKNIEVLKDQKYKEVMD